MSSNNRVRRAAKPRYGVMWGLALWGLLAGTACGPEGLGSSTPSAGGRAASFQRLDPTLDYPAGGHGFDADGNLLLIGAEETLRWLHSEKRFERYGGSLPNVDAGTLQRDGAGNLYLSANGSHFFTLRVGETAWTPLEITLPDPDPETDRSLRTGTLGLYIAQDGHQWVLAEYLENQGSGYVLYERAAGESAFRQRFEFAKNSEPLKFIGDIQRAIQLRADGSLYLQAGNAHFVLPPGANTPQPLLDCTTLVGSYCNGEYTVVSHPSSPTAYLVNAGFGPLQVFRLPDTGAYPVTPEPVQSFPGSVTQARQSRFQLDSQGRLWGALNQENALTVDYPPYLLDVTTLRRLEGDQWKEITQFQTPGFEWALSEHNTLYSFGRQLVSGGFWKGWGVYSFSF